MCKRCLIVSVLFLVLVGFGFLLIFKNAKGATVGLALSRAEGLVINEIAWAGSTNSPNDEWMELYNPSNETMALAGWKLKATDGSPDIALQGEIPPGGYFLLERTDDTSVPDIKANQIYSGSLDNKGEDLQLIDPNNIVRDEVNSTGGWPAGDNKTKATMTRDDANLAIMTWGNGPVNGTPLTKNTIINPPTPPANMPTVPVITPHQKADPTLKQKPAPPPAPEKKLSSAPPRTAAIAAFNARVQEQAAQQDNSPLGSMKDVAGALALLVIGALATYTIIKKRKRIEEM